MGFLFVVLSYSHAQTTISKKQAGWSLQVDGEPFEIKGVTFGYDDEVEKYGQYFQDLQSIGVNTIRTWGSGENTQTLLDSANYYGIKVMVGIWMRHGRPGMEADDSFNYLVDQEGMEGMYNNAIDIVSRYKDHPAVLTWGIGNEVYLNIETDEEKKAYSLLLKRIASKVKELDPNHPIISVEAWTFGLDWWPKLVPSIDIYGINCYGYGANLLPEEFEKKGVDKPYVITEFGVTGEWDAPKDANGITIEPTDQEKYDAIKTGYQEWIRPKPSCLGVYVFHYADGDQFVAPWLLTHYLGGTRPQYWAIREAYTGQTATNHPPVIQSFKLPSEATKSGSWVPVELSVSDLEEENLKISFAYNQRTGSRKRRDQIVPLTHRGSLEEGFEILLPKEHGPIKVYANAADEYPNVGIATTSMMLTGDEAEQKKYLVPKATLPFYVYQDGETPYAPSGYMGNTSAISVDLTHEDEVYAGTSSLMISYDARKDWYGVGFMDPPNDWGEVLGGYDISGATKFSFWAKASEDNIKATIGYGLIDANKPFPDTSKKSIEITLTKEWKQYTIKTKKEDLSCIRSGLVLFSSSSLFPHKIYLDDVVFE